MVTRKPEHGNLSREQARQALAQRQAGIEERTIAFRWYVVEHTPAGEDEIGGYIPPVTKIVSPYFSVRSDAEVWYGAHVPDQGKKLIIQRDRLVTTQIWIRG